MPRDLACSLRQYSAWWYVIGLGLPISAVYLRSLPDSFYGRKNGILYERTFINNYIFTSMLGKGRK